MNSNQGQKQALPSVATEGTREPACKTTARRQTRAEGRGRGQGYPWTHHTERLSMFMKLRPAPPPSLALLSTSNPSSVAPGREKRGQLLTQYLWAIDACGPARHQGTSSCRC